MGTGTDVTVRNADELNSNRVGKLTEIYAIVDRDKHGNEIILQTRELGAPFSQYLICSDERARKDFLKVARMVIASSRRNLRVVKLRVIETVEL